MNTLIGAIVGFLLAAAIITISYLLDDTIMTDEDVEQKLGMNLLGSLPEVTSDDNRKDSRRKKKKKR